MRGWRGSRGRGRGRGGSASNQPGPARGDDGTQIEERFENVKVNDEVDEKLGFARLSEGLRQEGWLVNMHPVSNFSREYLNAILTRLDRPCLRMQIGLEAVRLWTTILFKMMVGCSSAHYSTSRTFTSLARRVWSRWRIYYLISHF